MSMSVERRIGPESGMPIPEWLLDEALPAHVETQSGCWETRHAPCQRGYVELTRSRGGKSRKFLAHRLFYWKIVGPIKAGMTLDHTCRNRKCVNPAHLDPVDCRVNAARGMAPSTVAARLGVCSRGHKIDGGKRRCLVCARDTRRRWRLNNLDRERARERSSRARRIAALARAKETPHA